MDSRRIQGVACTCRHSAEFRYTGSRAGNVNIYGGPKFVARYTDIRSANIERHGYGQVGNLPHGCEQLRWIRRGFRLWRGAVGTRASSATVAWARRNSDYACPPPAPPLRRRGRKWGQL